MTEHSIEPGLTPGSIIIDGVSASQIDHDALVQIISDITGVERLVARVTVQSKRQVTPAGPSRTDHERFRSIAVALESWEVRAGDSGMSLQGLAHAIARDVREAMK